MNSRIKLTQFAKGAGCGCKIAPSVLSGILAASKSELPAPPGLLVGNGSSDDAAVYDLGNGEALIVTADFFMPVVDDAFTFGKVAAANALSDVYAMGGKPLTAIALLGWPVDKLPAGTAAEVMKGAQEVCRLAGIIISGGHTIDSPEPFFGLSVNGLAPVGNIRRNDTASDGDVILLSKPLGVGILATALKRGLLTAMEEAMLIGQLTTLNSFGEWLGNEGSVTAMTDVTGFGLLGHLTEMSAGAGLVAELRYSDIPRLQEALAYGRQGVIPDATYRNWNAYERTTWISPHVDAMEAFTLLPDPQTNGGLLLAVKAGDADHLLKEAAARQVELHRVGVFRADDQTGLRVRVI